jgi:hypothetical protein
VQLIWCSLCGQTLSADPLHVRNWEALRSFTVAACMHLISQVTGSWAYTARTRTWHCLCRQWHC